MDLSPDVIVEREVFGVTYERYALQKLCARLVKKYALKSVLELPASGAKAMPGLYSIGFALAGCEVTLVDADPEARRVWLDLDLEGKLTCLSRQELDTGRHWDLVWNFAFLPSVDDPASLIREMTSHSRRAVLIAAVNRFNVGFNLHRTVHKLYHIPWSHGDINFFSPMYTSDFLRRQGLEKVRWGVVDCPPWPDSPGFRDLRLHRQGQSPRRWISPYTEYVRNSSFPGWMKWVYLGERLPIPKIMKLPYAHLYYLVGQITDEVPR